MSRTADVLRVGSTFSGVGGADLGLERAGFQLAWTCEWDEWKRSILAAHWPDTPHYTDIRDLADEVAGLRRLQPCGNGGRDLHNAEGSAGHAGVAAIDLLIGGFPCQDLSVAGKRRGFDGERSVLAFEFLRIAESIRPRWLLMENVPGLLSSNGGRDLARLLDELGAIGYGWAYRILDARYFGVPQRRRRVFICAHRADANVDSGAAAALALRAIWEGSGGDPTPSWPPRALTTASVGGGAASGGGHDDVSPTLVRSIGRAPTGSTQDAITLAGIQAISSTVTRKWSKGSGGPAGDECQNLISFYPTGGSQNGFWATDGVSPTLKVGSGVGASSGNAIAYRKAKRAASDQDDETWTDDGIANTLNAFDAGDTRTTHAVVDTASTLQASGKSGGHQIDAEGAAGGDLIPQVTSTLQAQHGRGFACNAEMAAGGQLVPNNMSVRRLTPIECERLMGWPDNWTAPPGVKAPDSKRYAACGDGIVSWVAYWIGCRIRMIEDERRAAA